MVVSSSAFSRRKLSALADHHFGSPPPSRCVHPQPGFRNIPPPAADPVYPVYPGPKIFSLFRPQNVVSISDMHKLLWLRTPRQHRPKNRRFYISTWTLVHVLHGREQSTAAWIKDGFTVGRRRRAGAQLNRDAQVCRWLRPPALSCRDL